MGLNAGIEQKNRVLYFLIQEMSLKKKAVSGLIWTFTQQFSVQAINVVIGIVLARVLTPGIFGLIGMLTVFIAIGTSLMDSGMTSSLIRTNDATQNDYSTVFFVNLIFSVLLYCILYACAPLIADFYHQPILSPITRVYTLSFIIRAFVGVQTTKLTKEMRFKEQMFMQIPSTIAGGLLGVFLAYKGYGVWSLVWMNLAQSSLFTIQHWIFSGWTPSLIIDRSRLKYHLHFGYKLTISGLIDAVYANIYRIVIGRYFSASDVGYYSQARNLQMLPINNISNALNKVTYPLFASVKNDNVKLKEAYRKLLHQVIFWVAPMMLLAIVVAKPLFILLLTDKWLPAVPFFQLLCLSGILYPFHTYNLNILNVKGRSDLFLKLEIIKKVFITVGIAVSIFYGIYALLYFQVIASVFAFCVNTWYSGKFIDYSGRQQMMEAMPAILVAGKTALIVWLCHRFLLEPYHLPNAAIVAIMIILYGSLYYGFAKLYKMEALKEFVQLIIKRK